MAKRTGPTNIYLRNLIVELKRFGNEKGINLWKRIAEDLNRSTRERREVNISRINKYTKEGDIVLVPGKVLSMGELNKNVTVAGWRFSKSAEEKINRKGKAITIQELMKQNPEGKKVRIMG